MISSSTLSRIALLAAFALLPVSSFAREHKETVLYRFSGIPDGAVPFASLIADAKGIFYGTTLDGGSRNVGTVFRLAPNGKETVLYSFKGGEDGVRPEAKLLLDAQGNLYGTSSSGVQDVNYGAVFRLTPNGKVTVLHQFISRSEGASPIGGVIADSAGNLYGTTAQGGIGCGRDGCGTVFKLTPKGIRTILHHFAGGDDGSYPGGELVADAEGNLYGTTYSGGGAGQCSRSGACGTVFKVTPGGQETVLYAFPSGGGSGANPQATLIFDADGNLYGTTRRGGGSSACDSGCGTVFKLTPDGEETVLYAFAGGSDGAEPIGGVIADGDGNFYGTTYSGGGGACTGGCGTVFKVTPDGKERLLHKFSGGSDGGYSFAGLIADAKGNLYGTTVQGGGAGCNGQGCGVVFEVKN